jgi:hypothetical protein
MRQVNAKKMVALALLGMVGCGKTATTKPHDASVDPPGERQPETSSPADLPGPRDGTTGPDSIVLPDLPAVDGPPAADAARGLDQAIDGSTVSIDVPAIDGPTGIDAPAMDVPAPIDAPAAYDVSTGDPIKPWVEVGYSPDVANLAASCSQTGGHVAMVYCWVPGVTEFFDTCATPLSACWTCKYTCQDLAYCVCPSNGCFKLSYGCVTRATCTVGEDQTCNDNPALSAIHGHCIEGGYCQCNGGANPLTGKCL